MALRIGVDSGGTFTDICLFEESTGQIAVWKVSSTPADPSWAVVGGIAGALAQIGAQARDVSYFGNGTTVANNELIQHRGLTGLITSPPGFGTLWRRGNLLAQHGDRHRRAEIEAYRQRLVHVAIEKALEQRLVLRP
jgi:N-methylhydantoinase A/oxoprolinase/acetone carboxylase beta subunit